MVCWNKCECLGFFKIYIDFEMKFIFCFFEWGMNIVDIGIGYVYVWFKGYFIVV